MKPLKGAAEDFTTQFSKPVYFTRFASGQLGDQIWFASDENVDVANAKKAILGQWQAHFTSGKGIVRVSESQVQGEVETQYKRSKRGADEFEMYVEYAAADFKRVVPSVALEQKEFKYDVHSHKVFTNQGAIKHVTSQEIFNFAGGHETNKRSKEQQLGKFDQAQLESDMFQGVVNTEIRLEQMTPPQESDQVPVDLSGFVSHSFDYQHVDRSKTDEARLRKRDTIIVDDSFLGHLQSNPTDTALLATLRYALEASRENVNRLVSFLEQGNAQDLMHLQTACYTAMAESGDVMAHAYLSEKLQMSQSDGRMALANALVFVRSPSEKLIRTMREILSGKRGSAGKEEDALLLAYGVILGRMEAPPGKASGFMIQELRSASVTRKVHLLLALGNMRANVPVDEVVGYLQDSSSDVRHAATVALRDKMQSEKVREALVKMVANETSYDVLSYLVSHESMAAKNERIVQLDPLREALLSKLHKEASLMDEGLRLVFADFVSSVLANHDNARQLLHKRGLQWDESEPLYDFILSEADRKQDTSRFPYHKSFLDAKQLGPDAANLQAGMGLFAGLNTDIGCGQAKSYGRLLTQAKLFTKTFSVGEVLAFGSVGGVSTGTGDGFKAYAMIAGITLLDVQHALECKADSKPLLPPQQFPIVEAPFVFPISVFTISFELSAAAGFHLDLAYEYCASMPRAEAAVTPHISLTLAAGANVGIIGIAKGGLDLSGHFNYKLAAVIEAGAVSQSLCGACISLQHGFDTMDIGLTLYFKILFVNFAKKVLDYKVPIMNMADLARACIDFRSFNPSINVTLPLLPPVNINSLPQLGNSSSHLQNNELI
jgi:HEAT repeat protein